MEIKLVDKKVEWVPGEGVRTTIKVTAQVPHYSDLGTRMTMQYKHEIYYVDTRMTMQLKHEIYIAGTGSPTVSLKVGNSLGAEKGKWVAILHDWLATTNYVEEWEEEVAKYRYVISQVDLPADTAVWPGHITYNSHGVGKDSHALTYKLMMGEIGFFISVVVMAKYEGALGYIGLQEADDYYDESTYLRMGEVPLTYPITVDSVKAAVGPAVDTFLSKVGQLASEPLVEELPPEDFYGR